MIKKKQIKVITSLSPNAKYSFMHIVFHSDYLKNENGFYIISDINGFLHRYPIKSTIISELCYVEE